MPCIGGICRPLRFGSLKYQNLRPSAARLEDDIAVDVAVIGGGFVGLWTAIELKQSDPSLKVALFEQGRVGTARLGGTAASLCHGGPR